MKLKLIGDKIAVRQYVEKTDKTESGLFIPEQAQEKPLQGVVCFVGEGRYSEAGNLIPLQIERGDEVFFSKYAGVEITVEGKKFLIMKPDEILAVILK